jgi:hypothetical protein
MGTVGLTYDVDFADAGSGDTVKDRVLKDQVHSRPMNPGFDSRPLLVDPSICTVMGSGQNVGWPEMSALAWSHFSIR